MGVREGVNGLTGSLFNQNICALTITSQCCLLITHKMRFIMKKNLLAVAVLSLVLPIMSYANCPDASRVTFKCFEMGGKKHCQWSADWWDGFHGDADAGEHPEKFFEAFWGAASDSEMGSTICFYRDKHGHLVELSQNTWGGVPKPVAPVWHDGQWPEGKAAGKVCDASVSACSFNYGH
jgi:hypothetical protein